MNILNQECSINRDFAFFLLMSEGNSQVKSRSFYNCSNWYLPFLGRYASAKMLITSGGTHVPGPTCFKEDAITALHIIQILK